MISERNYSDITPADLKDLLEGSIARLDEYFIFGKGAKWSTSYNIRKPLCIALCQGAAMHYYDKINGIKDFDVWFFYPFNQKHLPYRTIWAWDYQNSKFGQHPEMKDYEGRKVDVIVRSLKEYNVADPIGTIKNYLSQKRNKSAEELSKKAVVLLSPEAYFGKTIWYKGHRITPPSTQTR